MRRSSIRFGAVGVRGGDEQSGAAIPTATITYSLSEEADTVRWVQEEVQARGTLPLTEAEAVVRSLSIAMHGGRQIVIPLLQLKEFDQYTTTHSMNVAVLTMALAESRGLSARDVRVFGVAGLLHDIGKVKIPIEVLTKPGRFSDTERALMNRHPAEGARLILRAEEDLDLAAVVAYEHHIMLNGDGYPTFQFRRDCHEGSKLVQDRKSTRLNSSHSQISYAVFCLQTKQDPRPHVALVVHVAGEHRQQHQHTPGQPEPTRHREQGEHARVLSRVLRRLHRGLHEPHP